MDKKVGKSPHISLRLPKEQIVCATRFAKERGITRSKLLRELIARTPTIWPMAQSDQPVQQISK